MERAKAGDAVRVHYAGRLEDGTVFDSSAGKEPLEFTIGNGMVIPGFEAAVVGMSPGERKRVKIPPEEAYGPRRQEMVMEVERRCIPQEFEPEVGQVLQIGGSRERMLQVAVSEVTESSVFLDANHPLAGKALLFEVEMVEILGSRRDGKDEGTEETQEKQEMEEMEEMEEMRG